MTIQNIDDNIENRRSNCKYNENKIIKVMWIVNSTQYIRERVQFEWAWVDVTKMLVVIIQYMLFVILFLFQIEKHYESTLMRPSGEIYM